MLLAMLNHPRFIAGDFDTSTLRAVISGGSPVPVVLMEQIKAKMGADLIIAFGMTEASGYISHTLSTDTFELKSSKVGIPLPYIDTLQPLTRFFNLLLEDVFTKTNGSKYLIGLSKHGILYRYTHICRFRSRNFDRSSIACYRSA